MGSRGGAEKKVSGMPWVAVGSADWDECLRRWERDVVAGSTRPGGNPALRAWHWIASLRSQ